MDRLQQYRQIIRQVLTEQAYPYDHYQLAYIGWENQKRIFSLILHFDIKDGKIWVQYNGTETAIAQVLTEKGVSVSDIVLGFHSPFKRQFSGYAVT
jgi:XisI protein